MSKVAKLSIALTGEMAEAVRVAVQAGDYASTSEVIRDALRDWSEKRQDRAAAIAHARRLIQDGLESGAPQEPEPLEEMLARNRRRLAQDRAAQT